MATSNLQAFERIYCEGHEDIRGNERANSLALKAPSIGRLKMGEKEILLTIRDNLIRQTV